jgi:hypothetical protein
MMITFDRLRCELHFFEAAGEIKPSIKLSLSQTVIQLWCKQVIAGLDCWIAQSGLQSGLQSSLVDWIAIDNPNSKLDFGFGLSIQFFHFNPNPKRVQKFFH